MNKPASCRFRICLGLAAFVAGRYTSNSSAPAHSSAKRVLIMSTDAPGLSPDKPGIAPTAAWPRARLRRRCSRRQAQTRSGRFSQSESQQRIGARVETVAKNSGSRTIRTTGRVQVDDNRVYRLMAVTEGRVQSLGDNPPGTLVKKDESGPFLQPRIPQCGTSLPRLAYQHGAPEKAGRIPKIPPRAATPTSASMRATPRPGHGRPAN